MPSMHHAFQPIMDLHRFEPIMSLQGESIIGYEALARFADGIPPDQHWRAAHGRRITDDHLRPLQRLEIRSWVGAVRAAEQRALTGALFVNTVPAVVFDPACRRVLSSLRRRAEQHGMVLVPELIENGGASLEVLQAAAARLRASSFTAISLDDCLEGSTPLMAITRIRPKYAKVDVSFLEQHPGLARALIAEVRSWSGRVVVERVERQEHAILAAELGATHGQGFFWGKPE